MNDLIESLQRFLDAGDNDDRYYQLNAAQVRMVLDKLCKCVEVPVLTFDDIRKEVRAKRG